MTIIILLALVLLLIFFTNQNNGRFRLAWILSSLAIGLLIVISTEILSLVKQLTQGALIIFWVSVILIILTLLIREKIELHCVSWNIFYNKIFNIASLVIPALILMTTFAIAIVSPPNNTDAMVYHLSRVAHWAQYQSVAFFPTSTLRELYLNPFAEYALLHTYLLSGSDRLVNLVQWFSYLNLAILVSLLAEKLGASKKGQYFASIFALTLPQALLQSTTTQNDLVFSSIALMSVYFLICFAQENKPLWIIPAGIATSLAVLSKSTAFIVLTPFLVWTLINILRHIEKRKLLYTAISLTSALIIMLPFYMRNWSAFGSPLGPESETGMYQNDKIGIQSLVSNSLRNFAINLTYAPKVSEFEENTINGIHSLFNWDSSDPATSWQDYDFSIPGFVVNEDTSGNPIHIWLTLVVVLIALVKKKPQSNSSTALALCIVIGYFLFSLLLKWQPWNNRLQTIFFLLIAPLFGLIFEHKKILSFSISIVLLVSTIPYFFLNPTKPLTQDWNTFNLPRVESMIRNDEILGPYVRSAQVIEDTPCTKYGLDLANGYWEYPLWYLLVDPISPYRTLQHINVNNESSNLLADEYVCGVIVVNSETKPLNYQINFREYELSFVEEPVGVYLLSTP